MTIAQSILPEFKHEMASTRRVLERVPEEHSPWKPHPKSYAFGELAVHVANIPGWIPVVLQHDEFNFDVSGPAIFPRAFTSHAALLERFDRNVAEAEAAISSASDDELKKSWSLKNQGAVLFTVPRVSALRSFVMNHHIHHRGQLTVYLRLKDVPLPAIYGSSADERPR